MSVSRFFVTRPVFAWVMTISIMLAGLMALRMLPVSQYPDVSPPLVRVSTVYPGASAQVVENSVTQILEQELKAHAKLKEDPPTALKVGTQCSWRSTWNHGMWWWCRRHF